jgi:hypothetical protein
VARSLITIRSLPYVKGAWLYNFTDCTVKEGGVWHPDFTEDNFGLVKRDSTPKPAYWVLRDVAEVIRTGRFVRESGRTSDHDEPQQVRVFEFEMPDGGAASAVWHAGAGWGSWCTFQVSGPAKSTVELLHLGAGTPIQRNLEPDGTFRLFLEGDDVPWLLRWRGKGLKLEDVKWVRTARPSTRKRQELTAAKLSTKPRIDGKLEDWSGRTFVELGKPIWNDEGEWGGKKDLSVRFAAGWDADALYLAVEVRDDKHFQAKAYTDIYKGDSLQAAWLAPGDPKHDYAEIGFALTPKGKKTLAWFLPSRLQSNPSAALGSVNLAVKVYPGRTVYEAAVPLKSGLLGDPTRITAAWKAGLGFPFALAVNDNDGKGRKQACAWADGIITRKDPVLYGKILLKP